MTYTDENDLDDEVVETPFVEEAPAAELPQRSVVIVRPHVMLAAMVAMSTEETRYYLNGIFIQPHEDGGIVLTATDGHLLVTIRDSFGYAEGPAQIWQIKDMVSMIKAKISAQGKFLKDKALLRYEFDGSTTDGKGNRRQGKSRLGIAFQDVDDVKDMEVGSEHCDMLASPACIDGTFPEYGRVIPQVGETRSGACIQAALLMRIGKFAQEITNAKLAAVNLEISDESGPSCFHVAAPGEGLDAIGVVMPMRGPARLHHHPDWLVKVTGRPELGAPPPVEMIKTSEDAESDDQVAKAA
jgi:hypothetical protein